MLSVIVDLSFAQSVNGDTAAESSGSGLGEIERPVGLFSQREVELAEMLNQIRKSALEQALAVIDLQTDINTVQARIDALRIEEDAALEILDGQRARLNRLAGGLQRLSRTPVEVWAIADGPSAELIRGALLLNRAMEPVEEEADAIGETIAALSNARSRLDRERTERNEIIQFREERMSELNRLIGDRQNTLEQLVEEEHSLAEHLSDLAQETQTIGDLIDAMDSDDQLRALEARIAATRAAIAEVAAQAGNGEGSSERVDVILPAVGIVESEFGAEQPSGGQADRMTLAVAPATLVVAPLAGIVRYSGPLMDDGLTVILDHGGGYHSIIARVGRLDVMAGQAVLTGEPIAVTALPQSETTPTSSLFFEVRRNGSPVNPMTELVLAQGRGPE
jgi:septal ring factor EnvC (AmiA/AmiB activator)